MALNLKTRSTTPTVDGEQQQSAPPPIRKKLGTSPSNGTRVHTPTGFVQASTPTMHRLIVNAEGEEKSGKNHFAFTAPGPIYMHSFDIGNEGVVQKFQNDKQIMIAEYELELQPDEGSAQEVAEAADRVWNSFMSNFRDGLASCGHGTTVVDTASEMWELLRLARFGKLTQVMPHHYGPVNKEMQEAVREAFGHSCNAVFLHKMKDGWENYVEGGKEKGRKTGQKVRVGFNDIPFLVQVNVRCLREDQEGGGSQFLINIEDCRQNPDLNNTQMPNDFEMLLSSVFND
jgi:hypothetical protein